MKSPTPAINLIGPERISVPGTLTKAGFLKVSHMHPCGRDSSGIGVSKFSVCEGVYDKADVKLVGEIIGIRHQQEAGKFAQSWTVDSFVRAGEGAKSSSRNRSDLILLDVEILQFVYKEITGDWPGVKKSDRFDTACEILRNVVGHVTLGRTTARKKVKNLLINSVELEDSLHRLNPQANAQRISMATVEFMAQTKFDYLSEKSLDNALLVALLLQKQVAGFLDYLKLCIIMLDSDKGKKPTRSSLNTIYRVMDIKPYSYALAYVRKQKSQRKLKIQEELVVLHDALSIEFRLSMISTLCSQLKHTPGCHDTTVEEMITTALINRSDFLVYSATFRLIRKQWEECKKLIADGEVKKVVKSLEAIQSLIRVRKVEVTVGDTKKLVRASEIPNHPWFVQVLPREWEY